jgi:hypothetical protein
MYNFADRIDFDSGVSSRDENFVFTSGNEKENPI